VQGPAGEVLRGGGQHPKVEDRKERQHALEVEERQAVGGAGRVREPRQETLG